LRVAAWSTSAIDAGNVKALSDKMIMENHRAAARLVAMTGDIEISPAMKINSPTALVHALRTAGKPVRDVYRGQGGGYWISFDGWEVDPAALDEAVAEGWLVLSYPKKSWEWSRLPEHMPVPRPIGWPRARRVRGQRRKVR
jgi:hypothetical protein